ncbi:DUF3035 domain-containing protein [Alphaproteobacteria bacterium]|nr:DUF3035 domain-containing protein [Alphaproteobacteria bacterium]
MIIKNKVNLTLVLVVFLTTLAGCSGKSAPDEFLVLKNAPLSLPPEFYLTPGGARCRP